MSEKHAIRPPKQAKSVKSQTDYISELPADILSSIVSYFSVRDAVNASLLSRRWRHICASMYILNFDRRSMLVDSNKHFDTWLDHKLDPCPQYKDRFVKGVNQFLQYYKGSQLECFRVSYCLEEDSSDYIDQWVRFAVSMGIKRLYLHLSCNLSFEFYWRRCQDRQLYILNSELLSQGKVAKLQQLSLGSCILGPNVINQFSCLKCLAFYEVPLGQHEVESILSCCLDLESMTLTSCGLPLQLCISGSLRRLKFLSISHCKGVEEIEVTASTLTSFEYAGYIIKFSFSRLPNLQKVYFRARNEKSIEYIFNQLAKDFPMVETLSVSAAAYKVQCLPKHVTTTFGNVKKFEFFYLSTITFDYLKLIRILKSCPLLEKLYFGKYRVKRGQKIKEMPVPTNSVHKHLKEVHMGGFQLHSGYIEFALYLLEYAAALEQMVIDPQLKFGTNFWSKGWKAWDEGEREAVCARLTDCSKSSVIIIK